MMTINPYESPEDQPTSGQPAPQSAENRDRTKILIDLGVTISLLTFPFLLAILFSMLFGNNDDYGIMFVYGLAMGACVSFGLAMFVFTKNLPKVRVIVFGLIFVFGTLAILFGILAILFVWMSK